LLRLHVQIAPMNRSESTAEPSGISIRTGPSIINGPPVVMRTRRESTGSVGDVIIA
jgi:hypothetical protein